jgi:pimeloyl-ACP methyl ester carboxylesterase
MELFYREYGESNKVIIILHGMLGMSDNWVHFARKLSENYRVIVPDMRNHGNSPHNEKHSYRYMARDLYELTEKLNIPNAIVMGHSMGGKTAMQYAADYPDRTKKMIILDIAPRAYTADEFEQAGKINHPKLLKTLTEINLKQFGTRQQITDYFETVPQADQIKYFLQKNIQKSNSGGYEFKFSPENILKNIENMSGKPAFGKNVFKKDVLFVKGEKSGYIKSSDEADIKELYPNSQIKSIADAGHIIHAEKPTELLKTLREFL